MIILSYSCRGDKAGNESQLKMVTIQKDFSFQVLYQGFTVTRHFQSFDSIYVLTPWLNKGESLT